MERKDTFAFDVFLSYSRKDIAFARLLEKTLRSYRPPKEFGIQRPLKVFRDESDLVGSDLTQALEANLARSSKLVVICSPASRLSIYVGLEIQTFARLRGPENIIVVLYCEPAQLGSFSDDTPDSLFHPELVAMFGNPLAEDYRGFDPKRQKTNRGKFQFRWFGLLARIYDREKADVERRERRRQATTRRLWSTLLVGFSVSLAMLSIWAVIERNNAVHQSQIALSRQLAAQAIEASSRSLDLALLLSLQAVLTNDSRETENALARNVHLHGALKQFLAAHSDTVWSVSFSPDGRRIATGSQDHSVIVWDARSGAPIGDAYLYRGAVRSVAFCPDGQSVASGDESGDVVIENLATRHAFKFSKQPAKVLSVAYSPDGSHLASANSIGQLYVWDLGEPRSVFLHINVDVVPGRSAEIRSIAFSPDGTLLASTTSDGNLALWDARNGKLRRRWVAHHGGAQGVAFSPDGTAIATSGDNGEVKLWAVATATAIQTFPVHRGKVYSVAFVQGGALLASAGEDQVIMLDDVASGREAFRVSAHEGAIYGIGANREGTLLGSTSFDRRLVLWNVAADSPRFMLGPQNASIRDIAFRPDGKEMASVNWVGELILWDTLTGRAKQTILAHSGEPAYRAVYSPDGRWLATAGGDNRVVLWDAVTHTRHLALAWHQRAVRSLAFSPDNRYLASGDRDGKIALWSVESGRMIEEIRGHDVDTAVYSLAFSPDSQTLASAGFDRQVLLHELRKGMLLAEHRLHQEAVRAITFSPDGKTIASGSVDGWVILWNVASDRKQKLFHGAGVGGVAYSPDGKTLVSVGDDRNVTLWDVRTGVVKVQLKGHEAKVQAVAFSPKNPFLIATAARDKTIRFWDIDLLQWRKDACEIANRNLTCGEWNTFVGTDIPYQRTCKNKPFPVDWNTKSKQCDVTATLGEPGSDSTRDQ